MPVVTRFAPSPTGYLHIGHAYAAHAAWQAARAVGGRFLVRLEDIDPQRCRPEYADAILEDLAWLGFTSDGPIRVQSHHLTDYQAALKNLANRELLYPCFCSRAEIARAAAAPHGPDNTPLYPGTCRHLSPTERADRIEAGHPHAWRLNMRAATKTAPPLGFYEQTKGWIQAAPETFGDVILARRDTPATYHLCVTHDDARQSITLVTRANDLFASTHLHVLLQHLMHWPTPAYAHHPRLTAPSGAPLSKRTQAPALRTLRSQGATADEVLRMAGVAAEERKGRPGVQPLDPAGA